MAASLFPGVIVATVVVLGVGGVSGSSLGLYATINGATEHEAHMVTGPARGIRTDEWLVRTPWVLGQLERDRPTRVAGGVGTHDMAVLMDLPTRGWEVVLRPHTAGYWFFGIERGLAIEWWAYFALQMLGVYALLVTLSGRVAVSALAAALVTLSPASQWWTTPATFTTIGYGCLATALALRAHRAGGNRSRVALSALAGLTLAAFLAGLYPPWQIGTALVLLPVVAATVIPDLLDAADRGRVLRSLALVLAVTVGLGGSLFAAFVAQHRDAVEAISATVYPGQRNASKGGGTPLPIVLSATFDSYASSKPFSMVNGTNQSENSSALPLLLPVTCVCLALLVRRRFGASRSSPALIGCLVGGALVTGWMLLPIPSDIGSLVLLTRVPPSRLLLPVGLSGTIALALLVCHLLDTGGRIGWRLLLAAVGLTGAALWWAAGRYTVDGRDIDTWRAGLLVLIVLAGVALSLRRRPLLGLGILVAFTFWQASLVNPVQVGTGPLVTSPLRRAVDAIGAGEPADAGWIAFSADSTVRGTLTAAGVNNLAGVSPYPDYAAWRILDPGLASEDLWNRYTHIEFAVAPAGAPTGFTLLGPDRLSVAVDPCAAALRELGVRFMVAQGIEIGPCVRPLVRIPYGNSYVTVYRSQP